MKKLILIIIITLLNSNIFPQTAKEVVTKAENAIKGKTSHGTVEMTVVTPDYKRTLKMESWWVGNKKALIVIKSPRRERGNKTLKIGNEMWSYLANTETTIKIPPSMMLQSWNGSDFTNDDLVRESNIQRDYDLKIIGGDKIDGVKCWKIQGIPHPDAPVVWGKILYWVRQTDYLPAKVEYYDEKGVLKRYMEFKGIKKMGRRKLPTVWRMVNMVKKGHSTSFKLLSMKFNVKIPNRIFSFQELEKGNR